MTPMKNCSSCRRFDVSAASDVGQGTCRSPKWKTPMDMLHDEGCSEHEAVASNDDALLAQSA
jgi:hypothetical protein